MLLLLRACRDWRMPLSTVYSLGKRREFIPEDRTMLIALRAYEDGLCPGCHQPAALAHNPRNGGEFEVADDVECLACEAIELASEDKHPPGVKLRVINHMFDPGRKTRRRSTRG